MLRNIKFLGRKLGASTGGLRGGPGTTRRVAEKFDHVDTVMHPTKWPRRVIQAKKVTAPPSVEASAGKTIRKGQDNGLVESDETSTAGLAGPQTDNLKANLGGQRLGRFQLAGKIW